ncbi:MAG: hypothetical protein AAGJ09_06970 [Pseudomonadota bacterium]
MCFADTLAYMGNDAVHKRNAKAAAKVQQKSLLQDASNTADMADIDAAAQDFFALWQSSLRHAARFDTQTPRSNLNGDC